MAMKAPKSKNVTPSARLVDRAQREALMDHCGVTVWLTGLSGSGKSTVASHVDKVLTQRGIHCSVLDGDDLRFGLNSDLGFGPEDRDENIRRVGQVARLFTLAGVVNIIALISPYRAHRERNRAMQRPGDFVEVFVATPLQTCEERDPKGLYRRARRGEIPEFTGVSAPYEVPIAPEISLDTTEESPAQSALRVVHFLDQNGYLSSPRRTKICRDCQTTLLQTL